MVWSVVAQVFSTLSELIRIARLSEDDKDLEILVVVDENTHPFLSDNLKAQGGMIG